MKPFGIELLGVEEYRKKQSQALLYRLTPVFVPTHMSPL